MYLQIKKARLTEWDYYGKGNNITISMVGLYDSDWKHTKFLQLNDEVLNMLLNSKIHIEPKDDWLFTKWSLGNDI